MLVEGVSPKPPETHNTVMRAADFDKSAIIFAILPIHFQISFPAVMTENQIEVRLDSEHFFPLFFDAIVSSAKR